ncbi:hypothetical protein MCOR17_009378 [Pyricularia oryzae]|nr:hypothetical protein MCOR17_009378 [Pyricularia oryzae]
MVSVEKTADMAAAEPQADASPIWKTALERYFAETRKGGIKDAAIENHLWTVQTPEDLLNGIEAIVPPNTEPSISWARALKELKPGMLGLSLFAAIIVWAFGMEGKVAVLLWGSIRLILMTEIDSKKNAQPVLAELVEMLGELQRTLSRSQKYERELPMTDALSRESRTAETVAIIQNTKSKDPSVRLPCHSILHGLNLRFFGRESQMGILKETLGPEKNRQEMRAISIYGIGGVGKTQLALQYANTSLGIYDLIAWVPAESQIRLVQALSAFTTKLGLAEEHDQMGNSQVVQRLKDWLNTCGKNFLLVFDNVDDVEILEQIWPASSHASVIITTRSPSVASRRSKKKLSGLNVSLSNQRRK